jgi:hypothetical protein
MASGWDGGNVVVTGTDQWGGAQTETFTTGSDVTRLGTKVFATVDSAVKSAVGASAAGATIGTGEILGLGVDLSDSSGICIGDGSLDGAAVFSSTTDSVKPSIAADGTVYICIVNV